MKTSLFFLLLMLAVSTGCDSSVEPASPQLPGKGSSFAYEQNEFDPTGNQIDTTPVTFTIDSANMTIESRTDVFRMTSATDTLHFIRDADRSFLIYRPETEIFKGIVLPKRWQAVLKEYDTNVVEIGTYTGTTEINGMTANVTIRDREQYVGTSTVTVNGKTLEVIKKSFAVEVKVHIAQFGLTATTTVTDIYGFAPELGFLATINEIRTTDSEFSPIIPGRTEFELSSYTIK